MELTHTYKNKDTLTGLRTSFQQIILLFISKHVEVFEALTRGGTPYGGNWLPVSPAKPQRTSLAPEEQIVAIQQQIGELSQQVTVLSDQMNARQKKVAPTEEIGINRFRALQAES